MKTFTLPLSISAVINILGFYFLELFLFVVAYFLGFFKQILLQRILVSISSLDLPSQLNSLLLIITMTIPILLIMFMVNKKLFKLKVKIFFITHVLVVITIWGLLELMVAII